MEYFDDLSALRGLNFKSGLPTLMLRQTGADLPAEASAQSGIGQKGAFFNGLQWHPPGNAASLPGKLSFLPWFWAVARHRRNPQLFQGQGFP